MDFGLLSIIAATSWLDRLLGLEKFSIFDPQTSFSWQRPMPAWAWALVVMAVLIFAGWSYYKMLGKRPVRVALAVVRALLLLVIVALLAGPMLALESSRWTDDWLLILLDRSASMQIRDMTASGGSLLEANPGAVPVSRDEAVRNALGKHADLFIEQKLGGEHRQVMWLGFDGRVYDIDSPTQDAPFEIDPPNGQSTAIRTAINQALGRVAGRPVCGIVLLSDGRSPEATGADLVRRLIQHDVRVFAVPLGAEKMPFDLAVGKVDYPDKAFVNDVVPVTVTVESFGDDGAVDPSRVRVRLIDDQTDSVLDEHHGAAPGQTVRLRTQSKAAGRLTWHVEVDYESGVGQKQREIITDNNRHSISLELVDRPIRVLLVEGYPRWEYRYLKNLLIREKSISSSILLLSAGQQFAQEGDVPLARMPHDAQEFEPFDVVIIGDVPARHFGAMIMALLHDHVSVRGAGLLWIGGPYHTPHSYEATALADLLPMRLPTAVGRLDAAFGPVSMHPTPLAESLSVLILRSMGRDPSDAASWPSDLPPLRWGQQLGPLKPAVEVLGESQSTDDATAAVPLVVRMRYGGGQSIYLATDETWRWRYGRGEFYFEQFWIQLIRMLGRHRLQQDLAAVHLEVPHRQMQRDQTVLIELVINDELLIRRQFDSIKVDVVADDRPGVVIESIELQAAGETGETAKSIDPLAVGTGKRYRTLWRPGTTGSLTLRVVEPSLYDRAVSESVEVYHPDDEKRQPVPDHDRLAALAEQTRGRVVPLDDLWQLADPQAVPDNAVQEQNDIHEPIGRSILALLVVLTLLTAEWVGRKLVRLV